MSKVEDSEFSVRMKRYEDAYRHYLTPRSYLILRVDGRAFHSFTRGLDKPYDVGFACAMDAAAAELCKEAMGCQFAYGQSDEYSFLLTDFDRNETQQWFGGCLQKIVSIGASVFTEAFSHWERKRGAHFDCRAFLLPNRTETENYFIWRQQDASRNSLNMLASGYYSAKALMNKSGPERHEMLHAKGVNWAHHPTWFKHGRCIVRQKRDREVTWTHKKTNAVMSQMVNESFWGIDNEIPVFTRDREYIRQLIPEHETVALVYV